MHILEAALISHLATAGKRKAASDAPGGAEPSSKARWTLPRIFGFWRITSPMDR